jgi:hypothetical protein
MFFWKQNLLIFAGFALPIGKLISTVVSVLVIAVLLSKFVKALYKSVILLINI